MAKQAGLHQIRGKVGEHSYYSQKGVDVGLIRHINQGMSQRVKTGDEYVNTRLNMAEFGQACRIAGQVIQYITPKNRPIPLCFSQGRLARKILRQLKADAAQWGQRNFVDADGEKLAPILSSMSKNNFEEFGISMYAGAQGMVIIAEDDTFPGKMRAIGADGCFAIVNLANTMIGRYIPGTDVYIESNARYNSAEFDFNRPSYERVEITYPADLPSSSLFLNNKLSAVIILPYRTIDGTKHILQSECAMKVYPFIDLTE